MMRKNIKNIYLSYLLMPRLANEESIIEGAGQRELGQAQSICYFIVQLLYNYESSSREAALKSLLFRTEFYIHNMFLQGEETTNKSVQLKDDNCHLTGSSSHAAEISRKIRKMV